MMRVEIILTGPPACGKTRLAARFREWLRTVPEAAGAEAECFSYHADEQPDREGDLEFHIRSC